MATNSTSAPRRAHSLAVQAAGFSLLELLLVLVVIGLIASLAGISVSSGQRPYQIEGALRRFADVAEYALDEAALGGIDMGLLFAQREEPDHRVYSYQWLQRTGAGWELAPFDEDAYGRRDLPPAIELLLEVEGEPVPIYSESDFQVQEGERPPQPQVVYYSSGETTPGLMSWRDDRSGEVLWTLEWDLLGRATLLRGGVDDEAE